MPEQLSPSELPNLSELRRLFAQSGETRALATPSDDLTAMDAKHTELLTPIFVVLRDVIEWIVLHEPEGDLAVTTTWSDRLVFVEVRDAGTELPKPESVRADAEWAARVLTSASEWCAETDHDGRRLWVSLSTSRKRPEVTHT